LKVLGDFSHELLDSKRVLPARALEHGFGFRFPELKPALRHLLG
jgi:NAD dependent epimerase/dehydratase family enzyme